MRNVSFIILTLEIYKVLLPISMSIFLLPSCRGQSFHHTHKKKVFSEKHFLVQVSLNSFSFLPKTTVFLPCFIAGVHCV